MEISLDFKLCYKRHQKYVLFNQYNKLKLVKANKTIVSITVDGIEVKENCDDNNMFDIGINEGQWKKERIYIPPESQNEKVYTIEIEIKQPQNNLVPYSKHLIIPKFLHISGAGGNGKSQYIHVVELVKSHPSIMFVAPTTDAVKNLINRAKSVHRC